MQSKIFRPRFYNSESDKFGFNSIYVDSFDQYNECIIDSSKIIKNRDDFKNEMVKRFNCYIPKDLDMLNFKLISSSTGKARTLEKWVITSYWENKKRNSY